jgi:hypothetical protein
MFSGHGEFRSRWHTRHRFYSVTWGKIDIVGDIPEKAYLVAIPYRKRQFVTPDVTRSEFTRNITETTRPKIALSHYINLL